MLYNWYKEHIFKNMACSEGYQLLGVDFHAVLGKVEADILQVTKE